MIRKYDEFINEQSSYNLEKINELINAWPNIMIDEKNLSERVWGFAKNLNSNKGVKYLTDRLRMIEDPNNVLKSKDKVRDLKIKLSCIMLLRYLKQIKENFSASPAGFQFEHYIMGLLGPPTKETKYPEVFPEKRTNGPIDIIDGDIRIQVKFISNAYNKADGNETLLNRYKISENVFKKNDVFIFGIKHVNMVDIFILNNSKGKESTIGPYNIGRYLIKDKGNKPKIDSDGNRYIDLSKLKQHGANINGNINRYQLNINDNDIEEKITLLSNDLNQILSKIWSEFDGFRVDIEDFITNIDIENNTKIDSMHNRIINFTRYVDELDTLNDN